ncbi:MAG: TrbI F-type domain-containing protein [bacterium]
MEKNKTTVFAITWLITLIISIGGGFIGSRIYDTYFNKPVKFYQFDLVKAVKNENSVLYGAHTTKAQANRMFTNYLKKINKGLKKYSKNGIVFIKGAVVAGNVKDITNKIIGE